MKQHLGRVPQVLPKPVDPNPTPNLTAGFRYLRHVSKLAACHPQRFLLRHPGLYQFVGPLGDMRRNLLLNVVPPLPEPTHDRTGFITRAMPSSIRSKLDVSFSRCFLPKAVTL